MKIRSQGLVIETFSLHHGAIFSQEVPSLPEAGFFAG